MSTAVSFNLTPTHCKQKFTANQHRSYFHTRLFSNMVEQQEQSSAVKPTVFFVLG